MSANPARRIPSVKRQGEKENSPGGPPIGRRRWLGLPSAILILTLAFAADAIAQPQLESAYARLMFSNPEDIATLNKSIDFGESGGWFASSDPAAVEKRLRGKIDALYDKAQRILDMRKPMRPKVLLRVLHDENERATTFFKIFKRNGQARAWYVYEFNTVYINAQDVNEGIIAHEFAHAIIDHYLSVRPPRASAEILATYVDKYLFDDVRTRNDFQ
ncbi:MAG: hypothetical protein LBU39_04595 [Desulfobulbaceae bacterium]|jgi:hypothetical protein|nr:hypothetical protein [Desulfobulbaceae bacterium]